ncbi:hypothetical protein IJ768_02910 [Candidatus Saccharibacteria bacterium]|nr:hypothetical protein [Candidatus Saccharibacteria bacterium]
MGIKITKKQQRLLDFIADYTAQNDVSPTYREIAAGLGLKSVSGVAEHIDRLVSLGALRKNDEFGRVLEVVDLTFPETTSLFRSRMYIASDSEKEILRQAAKILGVEGIEDE